MPPAPERGQDELVPAPALRSAERTEVVEDGVEHGRHSSRAAREEAVSRVPSTEAEPDPTR